MQATQSKLIEPLALNVPDTSRALGLGLGSVHKLIAAGKLQTVLISGRRLVVYQSLKDLIATASATQSPDVGADA